jgi:hypothetical protein
LHPSFLVSNRTGLIDFAGDAPPSIARQSQSLLYLFFLLGWFFHPSQRILHDEDVNPFKADEPHAVHDCVTVGNG